MTTRRAVATGLKRRCLLCKKLRGFSEPSSDQGGEKHLRHKPWMRTATGLVCGWCVDRNPLGVLIELAGGRTACDAANAELDDGRFTTAEVRAEIRAEEV